MDPASKDTSHSEKPPTGDVSRQRTVLITGAGFSVGIGHPLTNNLLRVGIAILVKHRQANSRYSVINETLRFLLAVASANKLRHKDGKKEIDLESLLQALWNSHKDQLGKSSPLQSAPSLSSWEDPEYLRQNNYGWQKQFDIDPGILVYSGNPKDIFDQVVLVIREILWWTWNGSTDTYVKKIEKEIGSLAGVITTNYDVLPEYIFPRQVQIDYGFSQNDYCVVRDVTVDNHRHIIASTKNIDGLKPRVPLIKLHGSINLALCPACNKVISFPLEFGGVNESFHAPTPMWYFAWEGAYRLGMIFHDCQPIPTEESKKREMRLRPLVAPPMTHKEDLDHWNILAPLQARALAVLDACDRVIIIGSAMRPSDHQLLGLIKTIKDKAIILYGSETDLDALKKLVPNSDVELRGFFLPEASIDIDQIPVWGVEPTKAKEYGEDDPTEEWLKKRADFLSMMEELKKTT